VSAFCPSRSQQRALKRNADIEVVVQEPTLTAEHLRLFNAYHRFMHREKGWPPHRHNPNSYARSFLMGNWEFAREFQYYQHGRLVGIGLADVTAESLSSIYFFHDPAWRAQSPGVFSILQQLAYAQQLGLSYHYLGYWVADSQSMAYKANYRPHEILTRYPTDEEEPEWRAPA
jgi:arginine-tRNA-protein transferase